MYGSVPSTIPVCVIDSPAVARRDPSRDSPLAAFARPKSRIFT
jgi:hypothetical protein